MRETLFSDEVVLATDLKKRQRYWLERARQTGGVTIVQGNAADLVLASRRKVARASMLPEATEGYAGGAKNAISHGNIPPRHSIMQARFIAKTFLLGAALGISAQFLRQLPEPWMSLGASTAPWVTVAFVTGIWASSGEGPTREKIFVAAGVIAAYLFAWLIFYHITFAVRESASIAVAWRQAWPYLLACIPASLALAAAGTFSHKGGILGDLCLAMPVAWSVPEAVGDGRYGGWSVASILVPVVVLLILSVYIIAKERRVNGLALCGCALGMGGLGTVLYPIAWWWLLGRY